MKVIVIDTETTGVSSKDQVIQMTYIPLPENIVILREAFELSQNSPKVFAEDLKNLSTTQMFKPNVPIHPKAQETHGIRYVDLLKHPPVSTLKAPEADVYLGHNISFDHRMLGKPDVKLICTMALAKQIGKKHGLDFPNHKLDDLTIHFFEKDAIAVTPEYHNAYMDCVKTLLVLLKLLEYTPGIKSWKELYNFLSLLKGVK